MADNDDPGRPMPVLVVMLLGSFVLMVLSAVFYGLGLPEDWARALFMATVMVWIVLGMALMVQGYSETRDIARAPSVPGAQEASEDEE